MDKDYWDNYYSKSKGVFHPSGFAEFCLKKFIDIGSKILDIGCGNGRDSNFFAMNKLDVVGFDQSEEGVRVASDHAASISSNAKFICDDIKNLNNLKDQNFSVVYSRFFIHSINELEQEKLFNDVYNLLNKGGKFMIEVRTDKDQMCGKGKQVGTNEYVTDHYRRFNNSKHLLKFILNTDFKLKYFIEKNGLAIFKNEDPVVARIILEK